MDHAAIPPSMRPSSIGRTSRGNGGFSSFKFMVDIEEKIQDMIYGTHFVYVRPGSDASERW